MNRRRALRLWLAGLMLLAFGLPAGAAEPSEPFGRRAAELVRVLSGELPAQGFFSPAFLDKVPADQIAAVTARLRSSYGRAQSLRRVEATSATSGIVLVEFERAVIRLQMAVAPDPPHRVEGLVVIGAESSALEPAAVVAELTALPGEVSLAVARLEASGPAMLLAEKPDRPVAIGSAFKLFVLAELVRAIKAGERRWSDVVPLGAPSLPSGFLRDWPPGSPMTLHSLAALMISQSDNSAADTLISVLGRDRLERLLPAIGVTASARNRPFLTTREAFALKLGDPGLLRRWKAADPPGRRALLAELGRVDSATLDPTRHGGRPTEIAAVEWFASPADLVRTLDWLRRNGDRTMLDLLAINPGLGRELAADFDYFGFKGGSEPGVLNLSFLLKTRSGRWIAVSASWNDPASALDEARFVASMSRLVTLLK